MRKWMVEFPRKIENRGIKIARIISIRITKSINHKESLHSIFYGVGVFSHVDIFKLTDYASSINRKIYTRTYPE